jgi:hypothetical protein
MKIQIPKKLRAEDFDSNSQDLINKIAFIYNSFCDEVFQTLNGGVDYNNLNRQISQVTITLDSSGALVNPPSIKLNLKTKVLGINVISATNQVNSSTYPTAAPFVNWTLNAGILNIAHVSGLQNGSKYTLTLELIGQ